jgi:metal-responsive CopG/Arc/MetJ family transcriptional regulator
MKKDIMKETTTKINVTLPNDLVEKIKENNYNRNQLIISLLKKYIEYKQK